MFANRTQHRAFSMSDTQSIVLVECKNAKHPKMTIYSSRKVKGKVFPRIIRLFSHLEITSSVQYMSNNVLDMVEIKYK